MDKRHFNRPLRFGWMPMRLHIAATPHLTDIRFVEFPFFHTANVPLVPAALHATRSLHRLRARIRLGHYSSRRDVAHPMRGAFPDVGLVLSGCAGPTLSLVNCRTRPGPPDHGADDHSCEPLMPLS